MPDPKPKYRLKSLVLSEVSLVDRPANPRATVVLCKRDDSKEHDMTEIEKRAAELEAQVAKQAEQAKALTEEVAFLKGNLEKTTAELAEVQKERDTLKAKVKEDEPPAKLDPAVQAQIDAALKKAAETEAELQKMRDEQDTAIYVAKAEGLKNLPQKPEELGPILKRVARNKATADDIIALETLLKAADALVEKGGPLAPSGSGARKAGTAEQKLDELAKAHAAEHKVTFAKAFATVLEANPALYREYINEQAAA